RLAVTAWVTTRVGAPAKSVLSKVPWRLPSSEVPWSSRSSRRWMRALEPLTSGNDLAGRDRQRHAGVSRYRSTGLSLSTMDGVRIVSGSYMRSGDRGPLSLDHTEMFRPVRL